MISFITTIIVIGILVFFHELGHFLLARIFGVGVEKFSLGFGPKLASKQVGLTEYRISAIPLGGYVKMVGDEPDKEVSPEQSDFAFNQKPPLQRLLIALAGPVFNIILAILIFWGLFAALGEYVLEPVVGEVDSDSPAAQAGLQSGDRIVEIQGTPVDSWEVMSELIGGSQGAPLEVVTKRDGQRQRHTISPHVISSPNIFGETVERYVIGIRSAGEFRQIELDLLSALGRSVTRTLDLAANSFAMVGKIVAGKTSLKENVGGPIQVVRTLGDQAEQNMIGLIGLIGGISVFLAVFNLLPIPVLDGGHILFYTIELILGRPVNKKVQEFALRVGVIFLIMFIGLVTYFDITRWIAE